MDSLSTIIVIGNAIEFFNDNPATDELDVEYRVKVNFNNIYFKNNFFKISLFYIKKTIYKALPCINFTIIILISIIILILMMIMIMLTIITRA